MALFVYGSVAKCSRFSTIFNGQNRVLLTGTFIKSFSSAPTSSTAASKKDNKITNQKEITKSVFISQSRDIYTNLALEDWLYKNFDFTNHHVMLLWRNEPCVVIGRHQNPWQEADVENLDKSGIALARRNSGGGSVYHDEGNLNITFFTPKDRYNRKENLEILSRTLQKEWNLTPEINKKEDIVLDNNNKISGTASRLGRPNSYHHCTLLVDVDREKLSKSLQKNELSVMTTATKSVPAPTLNLNDINSDITMDKLMSAIGWSYLRTCPITKKDEGWKYVEKQRGFQMINPTESWFPGLEKIRTELNSWEWKFGKTPKFTVHKNYELTNPGHGVMRICLLVDKGIVEEVVLHLPDGVSWAGLTGKVPLVSTVTGQKFTPALFRQVENAIKLQSIEFHEESIKSNEMVARI
ncbi:hypothetical protein O3M35_008328 [Rhynocoris fuscipes]|uniref:BPL/LPL catalytic domain-containing protein n=1 Tax=Rhynocoris fuscipes TaxID=488301 RepID=A0AAW1D763_9HEMI